MNEKVEITLTINGRNYPIRVEPRRTLVDALRDEDPAPSSSTASRCARA